MKILLVGEYNNFHKFLKKGLEEHGHEISLIGLKDGFKNVDIQKQICTPFDNGLLKKITVFLNILLGIDLRGYFILNWFIKRKALIKSYDVIQIINESPFLCEPITNRIILNKLFSWNKNIFLISCGTDYVSVKYALDRKFKYSILTPYLNNNLPKIQFRAALKYISKQHYKTHKIIFSKIKGVITTDLDYKIPYENTPKHLGMIPYPIILKNFEYNFVNDTSKIVIFHGINRANYYKKGNHLFENALKTIKSKYSDKIEIITVENLPYKEYIKSFNKCHILLDQVYAYDQGYNALEAMAKGKVVFTGAEIEFQNHYKLKERVAINALPNENLIAKEIEKLILDPRLIKEISLNARYFVEKYHNHKQIAGNYLNIWKDNN
jgi:hypothetical protein